MITVAHKPEETCQKHCQNMGHLIGLVFIGLLLIGLAVATAEAMNSYMVYFSWIDLTSVLFLLTDGCGGKVLYSLGSFTSSYHDPED